MRTAINLHKTTNLNSITNVEEDLIIKMITSSSRYLKFRTDHGIHEYLNGNMIKFWTDYSKFTKYLTKK